MGFRHCACWVLLGTSSYRGRNKAMSAKPCLQFSNIRLRTPQVMTSRWGKKPPKIGNSFLHSRSSKWPSVYCIGRIQAYVLQVLGENSPVRHHCVYCAIGPFDGRTRSQAEADGLRQ